MESKISFGRRLKSLRIEHGLSQRALGNVLSVSGVAITKLESGENAPSFALLLNAADYFDVSIDYLVGRVDKREINK